ncbi:hypothetical protein HMPREF0531_13082 [Lactiplantibacillus plantarum subsp. plantarum ATCC 14917 = JCM 1149 = CGMCC 1.2437]|nr:hypothetical protein HMPREF0531_13082 [Lactiplantibacillus plantarum subsp. plantarum ATCC 14917 = JCM 1149 = CGMCC 1.2437]
MEDQYLRRGLRLKSVSTAFQQLAEMPGSRLRTTLAKQVYAKLELFPAGLSWLFLAL